MFTEEMRCTQMLSGIQGYIISLKMHTNQGRFKDECWIKNWIQCKLIYCKLDQAGTWFIITQVISFYDIANLLLLDKKRWNNLRKHESFFYNKTDITMCLEYMRCYGQGTRFSSVHMMSKRLYHTISKPIINT